MGVSMKYRFIGWGLWILAASLPLAASAIDKGRPITERGPTNYYSNDPLRYQVESYHIGPGLRKMNAGLYKAARKDFEFVLNHYPNHPRALALMGELAIRMKKPEMAVPYFEHAIEMYPDTATTYAAYGVFLHKTGKLAAAIRNYRKSLALNPGLIESRYNLALAYFAMGDYVQANREAQKVYAEGYPLPGLRNKLRKVHAWKPLAKARQADHGGPNKD